MLISYFRILCFHLPLLQKLYQFIMKTKQKKEKTIKIANYYFVLKFTIGLKKNGQLTDIIA